MHYVTKTAGLKFIRDGKVVMLPAGAPVPEAESLPNFAAMMRIGQLALVGADGHSDGLAPHDDAQHARNVAETKQAEALARASIKKKPRSLSVDESREQIAGKKGGGRRAKVA